MLPMKSSATTTATGPETARLCAIPKVPVASASEMLDIVLIDTAHRGESHAAGGQTNQNPAAGLAHEVEKHAGQD